MSRSVSIRSARVVPSPRTDAMPNRTASSTPGPDCCAGSTGSSVAPASDAFRSGVRTTTPWRRASRTSECGLQNPIGWEFNRAAQKAAGSWYLIHDDA